MPTLVSTGDVQRAKLEIDRMRRSLRGWLKYRELNDAVLAGKAKTTKPLKYAATVIAQSRDWAAEQRLAKQLHVLLAETMPGVQLPEPDIQANPQAAVELAKIALHGPPTASPQAQGAWYMSWPVLIVGGLLLAVTTAIQSAADVAKHKEEIACRQSGACTDYGFWLKAGGIAALTWVAWQGGLGDRIKKLLKG